MSEACLKQINIPPKLATVRISLSVTSFGHYLAHLSLHLQPRNAKLYENRAASFHFIYSFILSVTTHSFVNFIHLFILLFCCFLVANKWLHIRGQEFRRKCSLDSDA